MTKPGPFDADDNDRCAWCTLLDADQRFILWMAAHILLIFALWAA